MSEETELDAEAAARLRRRYEREKAARREAEAIAEQGLRDLYQANVELDARVEERTRELEIARTQAVAANRAKSNFLAHISHEVHTPLNGIMGMLELLETSRADDREREWIRSASHSVSRLEHLFARLVRYIELEGMATPERSGRPLSTVLDDIAARWRTRCAAAGQLLLVESGGETDPEVAWSPLLDQAIDELLDNAVRHADAGAVRLTATVDLFGRSRIGVIDEGPGVAPEIEIAPGEVLEPAADVTTRVGDGLGLGLAFARRIAEVHEAVLVIERAGDGTAAWLTI